MHNTTIVAALGFGAFCLLGACQPTTDRAGVSPGKRQLAATLGLDPTQYTLGQLVRIRHNRERDGRS